MPDPKFCDLHMHSTVSDGTDHPESLGQLARRAGLDAIALTDHDTTAGLEACAQGCAEVGVAFVPGVEVSADPGPLMANPDPAQDQERHAADRNVVRRGTLHILGLFVRHDDVLLAEISNQMKDARDSRNPAIVAKLQQLGIEISYDEVTSLAQQQGTTIIGRPHIGQVLIDKGCVPDMADAFKQYIGQGGRAFVRRDRLAPADAIRAIHHAGGLAVLAHPVQLHYESEAQLELIVTRLKEIGLDGIEVRHSDHNPRHMMQFTSLAKKLDLLTSGGSDYHGRRKNVRLGQSGVPFSEFERLRDAAAKR